MISVQRMLNLLRNSDQHESTIYFEPISGTPFRAQLRIQLNVNAWIDRITLDDDGATEPAKSRAVRRFIPMAWIDQTITLNEGTSTRLKTVSGILAKGHRAHQSLKLVYILLVLFSVIAIITAVELFFWNRQRKMKQKSFYQYNEPEKPLLNQTLTTSPTTA